MTIVDIANLTGFSKSTISRVLKNDPNVKASTREKIKMVMQQNNFIHNKLAASMVSGSLQMVLIIAGDIADPYYGLSVKKIEEVLDQAGYMTILCSSKYNSAKEIRYLKLAAECRFAGVIMMTAIESQDLYDALDVLSCPVVLMNRYLKNREFDAIVQDNYKSAYRVTNYLIENGHRHIMHLSGFMGSSTADDRLNGYRKAMTDAKYEVRPDMVVYGNLTSECGAALATRLSQNQSDITAVFIGNDTMAAGFVRKWLNAKKRVPEDISVVCYGHTFMMDFMPISITTIGVDGSIIGEKAANQLLSRINGDQGPKRHIVLEAELITGSSVKLISKKTVCD